MWHTSQGDRTLRGSEAVLVAEAIDTMMDALQVHVDVEEADDAMPDCDTGIHVYDQMTVCQRIGSLHEAAHFLLTETETTLDLSAAAEATVAAIFVEIRDQVTMEIDLFGADSEIHTDWRRMVLAAAKEPSGEDEPDPKPSPESLPSLMSQEFAVWDDVIDGLASRILWDRDFEMSESFLDIDPGVSDRRRKLLGIDKNYFTTVAPDPRPEQAFSLISQTRDLIRRKPR